jgi:hypothetical protein
VKPRLSAIADALLSAAFNLAASWLILAAVPSTAWAAWSVLTFHYDTLRTGWNSQETTLTPSNTASSQFGLLQQVDLDSQVDAQPLFVPDVTINRQTYNVIYVATENNTVYAIDAASGNILLSKDLGAPVPLSQLPGNCGNNADVVGIHSTPVIDPATSTIYVMAFTDVNTAAPTWILHGLDLGTLSDKVTPVVVQASAPLADGSSYSFNGAVSRQRPALLEANGNIYAGFGSFCDLDAGVLRGFVLGWRAGTLTSLKANQLDDKRTRSAEDYFLTAVWMSGDGIAADGAGRLFFVTGNSDPSGTAYAPMLNPSESIVKMAPDLKKVEDYFTPSDPDYGVQVLDQHDGDFGSGGILLLPDQPLAVAAGKVGQMYLLDRHNLGGYSKNGVNQVLGTYSIGPCWCGESYFTGPDGIGRVVSSGGGQIMVWKVETSPPGLSLESQSQALPQSAQDGGFFTSVSSDGGSNPIIWAVGRPVSSSNDAVTLYAYDPVAAANGNTNWLFSGIAGTWPNLGGNANLVPVVADGRVYVASYAELEIFGLGADAAAAWQLTARLTHPKPPARMPLPTGSHEIYGTIMTIEDGEMILATRAATLVRVAVRGAIDAGQSVNLEIGKTVRVIGRYDGAHVLHAKNVIKAKPSPRAWPVDR